MRRKLLLLCVMVLLGTVAFAGVLAPERELLNFKFGLSKGNADIEVEDSDEVGDPEVTVDLSKTINIEYIASTASGFEYGVGVGATEIDTGAFIHDELKEAIKEEAGDIYSIPVYVLARFKFDNEKDWKPYVFGNLGFAYVNEEVVDAAESGDQNIVTDIGGELFAAVGVGAEYKEKLSVEFMFSQTTMDINRTAPDPDEQFDGDIDVKLLTLAVGYRLDF